MIGPSLTSSLPPSNTPGERRTLVFFPDDPAVHDVNVSVVITNVSVVITNMSVEVTKLGSFGNIDSFAGALLQHGMYAIGLGAKPIYSGQVDQITHDRPTFASVHPPCAINHLHLALSRPASFLPTGTVRDLFTCILSIYLLPHAPSSGNLVSSQDRSILLRAPSWTRKDSEPIQVGRGIWKRTKTVCNHW